MPLSFFFWMIYVLVLIIGVWFNYEPAQPLWYRRAGSYIALWILVGILGWEVFGSVVRR
jgi:hypothetical protein